MRWSVYSVQHKRGVRHLTGLGYVNAPHQARALSRAWEKWPEHIDETQTQAGFSVVPYIRDQWSLGRKTNLYHALAP